MVTLFRDLNAPCLVYGETAGTIQNVRNAPLNTKRKRHPFLHYIERHSVLTNKVQGKQQVLYGHQIIY